jgi:hypothetical protein
MAQFLLQAGHYASYNPLALIALSGLIFHRSLFWALAAGLAVALNFAVQMFTEFRISAKNLEDAQREFTDPASSFCLRVINDFSFYRIQDFTHIVRTRERLRKLVGEERFKASLKDNPWMWEGDPLKVFVASSKNGGVVGGAKAYCNPRGTSLIFLSTGLEDMNATQRFVLLHELEHVSVRGAIQLTYMHASRIWGPVGIAFMCFAATAWFHWVAIAIYAIEGVLMKCWYTMPIMREVIADSGALVRLDSYEERKLAAEDILQLYRDYLETLRPRKAGDAMVPFKRHAELVWRTRSLEDFLVLLKPGDTVPTREFHKTTSVPFLILYLAFFIYIGAITPAPGLAPLGLAALAILWSFLALSHVARRAIRASQALHEYVSAQPAT